MSDAKRWKHTYPIYVSKKIPLNTWTQEMQKTSEVMNYWTVNPLVNVVYDEGRHGIQFIWSYAV